MANFITYSRMVLVIPIAIAIELGAFNIALIVFIVAALTDWLDGFVARRTSTITEVGKVMDQIADKVLVDLTMVFLLEKGLISAWLVAVVIWRDLMVSAVRILAAKEGNVVAANIYGKLKTVFQMALLIALLSRGIFHLQSLVDLLAWTVLALTVLSMVVYLYQNRSVLKT